MTPPASDPLLDLAKGMRLVANSLEDYTYQNGLDRDERQHLLDAIFSLRDQASNVITAGAAQIGNEILAETAKIVQATETAKQVAKNLANIRKGITLALGLVAVAASVAVAVQTGNVAGLYSAGKAFYDTIEEVSKA